MIQLGGFGNAVDHCTGLCSLNGIYEYPIISSDTESANAPLTG